MVLQTKPAEICGDIVGLAWNPQRGEVRAGKASMHVGRDALNLLREFLRGVMRSGFEETTEQDPPGCGDSTALFAQQLEYPFDGVAVDCHVAWL